MAITKLGTLIVGIRGTVGGVVLSANKAGTYAKSWSKPTNPGSSKQYAQRGDLAIMGSKWRTLSAAQQAAWDTFAASPPETDYNSLGQQYYLSGFGWFCRICTRRRRTGQAEVLTAPANAPVAAPTTFSMTAYPANGDADRLRFDYTSGEFAAHYAILELSLAPSQGTNARTSRFLMTWEALGQYATYSEAGVRYYANFGETQVDQRFFARLYRQHADGIRSTPKSTYTDVIAYP